MITTEQKTKAGSQANEHGVYVKNVKQIKVPFPKAAGKTEVIINLVQDLDDEMWRSSYSVKAGTGGVSSSPSIRSGPYQSREDAIKAAAELARIWILKEVERGALSEASRRHINVALPVLDKWIIANTDAPFCEGCGCVPVACRCSKDDEDEENGFHPGFPPGFDPKRAEKGLGQEDEPSFEKALHGALHHVQDAAERWSLWQENGATDKELTAAIAREFGLGGGSTQHGSYRYKGGKSPEFTWPDNGRVRLNGKRLLAKVREVLEIGAPGAGVGDQELGQAEVDPEKKRLHEAAVARWRRERPASADAGESNGYHPQMLQMIPVGNIKPSPTNPRKHFNPDKLQELADSISEHGLIEPILVRPLSAPHDDNPLYQLVAGERRWRAAKLAGLKEIEAKVRGLDDKAVLEIQFIENLQRSDLSAIEEAEGYKRLLDEHGYTADSLAGKLAKSKSYVYGRLKLCNLPAPALEALAKGDLPATIGELIGRLPSAEMREKFWQDEFEDYRADWFEMPSFRDVKETIERQFMRELKGSPFSQTDGKLIPGVPSCAKCPKKTGNDRANYPDGRADLCTDVPCFQAKVQAHVKREAEKAKTAGASVLDEAETKKILQGTETKTWLTNEGRKKYFESDDEPWQTSDDRKYKDLLDGHMTPVVAVGPQGESHILYPRAEAEKILKDAHGIKLEISRASGSFKDSEKKRQEEKKLRQATVAEIVTRALADVDDTLFGSTRFLRIVARFLIDNGGADAARAIAKRRQIEYDPNNVRGSVEKIVDGLDDPGVLALVLECLIQQELDSWGQWGGDSGDRFPLCAYFDMKPSAVKKQVEARLKQEAKAKAKTKVKATTRA
jgi:ParB/RepB/Spo0J family partition protein